MIKRIIKTMLILFLLSFITLADDKIPLGINVDWAYDWSRNTVFTDLIKQARGFGNADEPWKNDEAVKYDKDGWPLNDFGIVVFTNRPAGEKEQVYDFSFNCGVMPRVLLTATKGKIYDLNYNKETELVTGKLFLPQNSLQLMMSFKNTEGGVRNLKIIQEGCDTKSVFTKEFITNLRSFSVLRFMELQNTNKTTVIKWEERCKPSDIFQNKNGMAWEYAIKLCNELNCDIWINIPHSASDEYIKSLADLLKNELKSNLNIYVEYSNEYWNTIFPQNAWLKGKAITRRNNEPDFKRISGEREYFWPGLIAADRLKEISDIFSVKFGKESINSRIRVVMGAQIVWPQVVEAQLEYIKKYYGEPSKYFYAIAGGAYVDAKNENIKSFDEEYNYISGKLNESENHLKYRENMKLVNKYNLKFIAYEGGIDIIGSNFKSNNDVVKRFVSQDERMKELIKIHLKKWYGATNNSLFMWYKSGASEEWGITDRMSNTKSSKMEAFEEMKNSFKSNP